MPQYKYATYNPGQYPDDVQAQFDAMSADGWHVHTALPNYSEVYILWEKDGSALANRLEQHLSVQRPDGGSVQFQVTGTVNEPPAESEQLDSPEG